MYGRIFKTTFAGSMVGAGTAVFAVWAYTLAHVDRDGSVELNPRLLAGILGDDVETIRSAIEFLCQPDPESRSIAEEGRRLVQAGTFMYEVVNYVEYARLTSAETVKMYNRINKAEYRARRRARELGPEGYEELPMSKDSPWTCPIGIDLDLDLNSTENKEKKDLNPDMSSSRKKPEKPKPKSSTDLAKAADLKKNTAMVFEYWQAMMGKPKATLTALRRQRVQAILKAEADGKPKYTVQDAISAINGCKRSPHHMGVNDQGTLYNDIELICRNETKFERFLEMGEKPSEVKNYARNSNGKQSSGDIIANRPWRRSPGEGVGDG